MENTSISVASDVLQQDPSQELAQRLLESFLSGRSLCTLHAYRKDLDDFQAYLRAPTLNAAVKTILTSSPGDANGLALSWRAWMVDAGLSAATVNRRLAALRSLIKLARVLGMIPWTLEVSGVEAHAYRDTRGPGASGVRRLVKEVLQRGDPKGLRDLAMIYLMASLALRRAEVVTLDLEHVDQEIGRVAVLGKGRTSREWITLPAAARVALTNWISSRGQTPGPLFVSFDRGHAGSHRITGAGLYDVVRKLGKTIGITVRPHGLRHASITEALELTAGNLRSASKFSRHRDINTLQTYDDNRTDIAGQVAELVDESFTTGGEDA